MAFTHCPVARFLVHTPRPQTNPADPRRLKAPCSWRGAFSFAPSANVDGMQKRPAPVGQAAKARTRAMGYWRALAAALVSADDGGAVRASSLLAVAGAGSMFRARSTPMSNTVDG